MFTLTLDTGRTIRVEGYKLPPIKGLEHWQLVVYDDGQVRGNRFEPSGKYTVGELRTGARFTEIIEPTVEQAEHKLFELLETRPIAEWNHVMKLTLEYTERIRQRQTRKAA